jgi:hypothetical protein
MLKVSGLLLLAGALASRADAQSPRRCAAASRELAQLSPREQLAQLSVAKRPDYIVMADGASCAPDSAAAPANSAIAFHLQPAVLRGGFLGGIADPRDDGSAWYGRGANYYLRAGFSVDTRWLHAVVAPDVWYAQNSAFQVFPSADATRNSFASPWYSFPYSIDLPSRMGATPVTQLELGESALWSSFAGVDAGISASTQQWGPGERGTLILDANSPGIPRAFLRTSRPIDTRLGAWSATVFAGALTESRFFDDDPNDDLRSIGAANIAWSPSDSSPWTLGLAHAFMRLGTPFAGDSQPVRGRANAISEFYAQFHDPASGLRVWTEIGHASPLPSPRQFLTIPYQGIVYDVGVDRAVTRHSGTLLFSAETADLEQPPDIRGQPTQDFYTSSNIPQAWTQRGQLLGYDTGPGSNTQWLSGDWIARRWSFGVFGERVRWNEDAFLRQFLPYPNRHDVTVRGGLRAGIVRFGRELAIELSTGTRLNYLFQNATFIPAYRTVDITLPELRFSITPGQ